jgi:hypothetical protein
MKNLLGIFLIASFMVACNNNSESKTTTDSSTINTNTTGNYSDGGPNNGLGDTADYSRMNNTASDTSKRDSLRK